MVLFSSLLMLYWWGVFVFDWCMEARGSLFFPKFLKNCSFLGVRFNSLPNSYLKKKIMFENYIWTRFEGKWVLLCSDIISREKICLKLRMLNVFYFPISYKIQSDTAWCKFLISLYQLRWNKEVTSAKNWPNIPPKSLKMFIEQFYRSSISSRKHRMFLSYDLKCDKDRSY